MVLLAFLESRTWKQVDLARRVGVERKQLVKILEDLQSDLMLERQEERPHVYWSVPKSWFPGAVAFRGEDVVDLARLLQLAPKSAKRDRLLQQITTLATGLAWSSTNSVLTRVLNPAEEAWLAALQRAAGQGEAVNIRYYTLSRGDIAWRFLSVHRLLIEQGRFIATCHRDDRLKWFRFDGVMAVEPATVEWFRVAAEEDVQRLLDESVDGFHSGAPPVECVFRVQRQDGPRARGGEPMASSSK